MKDKQELQKGKEGLEIEILGRGVSENGSRDILTLFREWFRNQMTIILMYEAYSKAIDDSTRARIQFFLQDIEHHYIGQAKSKSISDAFRYLRAYFNVYPYVYPTQNHRAIEMTHRICAEFGIAEIHKTTMTI